MKMGEAAGPASQQQCYISSPAAPVNSLAAEPSIRTTPFGNRSAAIHHGYGKLRLTIKLLREERKKRRITRPNITSSPLPIRVTRSTSRMRRTRSKSNGGIGRRLRSLKNLIPSNNPTTAAESESEDLDELLIHTAKYILSLQTRVWVMRSMVDQLEKASGFRS